MRLQFLGANRQVTGSRYFLEAGGLKLLIDCGLFQERQFLERNWEPSPVPPHAIDYVLLTHAHLDHVGLIPRLVAQGYRGPIITVEPSVDLAEIIMLDAGRIQEEDAQYKAKRHQREGRHGRFPEKPLYTEEDAKKAVPFLRGVKYNQPIALNDQVTATFHDAGHILGSAFLEIRETRPDNPLGRTRSLVFSGDLGQWDKPFLNPPTVFEQADYVVMESTYGDREHAKGGPIVEQLERVLLDTTARGGNLVIPTFALERAQELIYHFGQLMHSGRVPRMNIYLDSPMAIDVTDVFQRYCQYLDPQTRCRIEEHVPALDFPGLRLVHSVQDSMAINTTQGSKIIMASSGMCTGGRIKHHLRWNIPRSESTILFTGYQATGTLGRQILERNPEVRIHGRNWPVRAKIAHINGLSAHGDRGDLLRWLKAPRTPPKQLFLTHGEEQAALSLAKTVQQELGWTVSVPSYQETVDLE